MLYPKPCGLDFTFFYKALEDAPLRTTQIITYELVCIFKCIMNLYISKFKAMRIYNLFRKSMTGLPLSYTGMLCLSCWTWYKTATLQYCCL